MELYDTITEAFRHCRSEDGRVNAVKLGEAAMLIAPLYDRVFGTNFVSKHLKDDITSHGSGLTEAARVKPEYQFVDSMVPEMLREKSPDEIRGKWGEGIVELLWTKRALDFITRFLEYGVIKHLDKSLHECASMAYAEVLKPYHGFLVSSLVSLAFNLAPSRDKFLRLLGFESLEAAQEKLRPFVSAIRPILEHVHQVLTRYGCDFPDTV